jgi:hypothetical protein
MRRSSFVSGRLINPVMTKLIENGIEITAVHNALGYDALNAEKARVTEDGAAVLLNMLYQAQAMPRALQETGQRILAGLKRFAAKVAAVELHEIKRVQEGAAIAPAAAQHLEVCEAIEIGHHGLAVDQA